MPIQHIIAILLGVVFISVVVWQICRYRASKRQFDEFCTEFGFRKEEEDFEKVQQVIQSLVPDVTVADRMTGVRRKEYRVRKHYLAQVAGREIHLVSYYITYHRAKSVAGKLRSCFIAPVKMEHEYPLVLHCQPDFHLPGPFKFFQGFLNQLSRGLESDRIVVDLESGLELIKHVPPAEYEELVVYAPEDAAPFEEISRERWAHLAQAGSTGFLRISYAYGLMLFESIYLTSANCQGSRQVVTPREQMEYVQGFLQ